MLLLPNLSDTLRPRSSALQFLQDTPLLPDEEAAVDWIMLYARPVDLYNCAFSFAVTPEARTPKRGAGRKNHIPERYMIRLVPLIRDTKVYGVLRLLMKEERDADRTRNMLGIEPTPLSTQNIFFSTFLEQAITILEQGRLREAGIHLEVLQQTEVVRSALFSSVSHDLRTPLATIKAAVGDLLLEETRQEIDLYQSSTRTIEREVDRLDGLVENLLDMSRIEAGSLRLEKVWYPLDELVSDVVSHIQTHLGEREIKMSYPEDLPPVELDIVQIEQVVFNLLENALHYTPEGSQIDINVQRQENALQVSIADRGPGIPLTERETIFTKFYRIAQNGHSRGLGLGLAICQGVIQAHEGRIWVETREGGGSIFCFTLPTHEIEVSAIDE
jgi:two-component system sensor histidine kinase KdpD